MPRKQSVQICPQCGGIRLYYENALITGYKYHCKDCDYIGAFIIEKDYDEYLKEKDESENA